MGALTASRAGSRRWSAVVRRSAAFPEGAEGDRPGDFGAAAAGTQAEVAVLEASRGLISVVELPISALGRGGVVGPVNQFGEFLGGGPKSERLAGPVVEPAGDLV